MLASQPVAPIAGEGYVMTWQSTMTKIERLALPTSPYLLVLVVLLASLLGGGLRILFQPLMPLHPELPHLRYETLRQGGPSKPTPPKSIVMKSDFARWNGSTTNTQKMEGM